MTMDQGDGVYSIAAGEDVKVDPEMTAMVQQAAITAMTITGMSSLRRATPDSAFAPVSVDGIGQGGLLARPITAEQQAAMASRDAARVEIQRIVTENERLAEELAAARAELEAREEPPAGETGHTPPPVAAEGGTN